eukprot:CAMPEP_0177365160 /NCGR_PEP_ID=MMETSP0368-20130122/39176_1 /TAXON_ID=447022 ORGANISM="Scrippsiella hangoei-like, Strain SHHI-4" /NCGR_SAMPLE_ID=MMETSP0368 /ASSEMBLY_ACC=CAM_ASM_000363 /LENGTH=188 /DNA_ID=CAMNT_0018828071 /DNA_START=47 /DNA_END=613 /DNA_ORIENTATION=-
MASRLPAAARSLRPDRFVGGSSSGGRACATAFGGIGRRVVVLCRAPSGSEVCSCLSRSTRPAWRGFSARVPAPPPAADGGSGGEGAALTKEQRKAMEEKAAAKGGPPGQDRDIWLPHDLLPFGSPVFFLALVLIPCLIYYNETQDTKLKGENERLKEERLLRRTERERERGAEDVTADGVDAAPLSRT